ncbi:MAG: hypothetical protein WBE48_27775 [Xanthobacteraceae bacterium]
MVLAKAIGVNREITRAILQMRGPAGSIGGSMGAVEIEQNAQSFAKLQQKTAASAMTFYRLRARAEAPLEKVE